MLELFKVIALQSYTHTNCNLRRKAGRLSTNKVNNQPTPQQLFEFNPNIL